MVFRRKFRKIFLVSYGYARNSTDRGIGQQYITVEALSRKTCLVDADNAREAILIKNDFKDVIVTSIFEVRK